MLQHVLVLLVAIFIKLVDDVTKYRGISLSRYFSGYIIVGNVLIPRIPNFCFRANVTEQLCGDNRTGQTTGQLITEALND